jgi:Ca-activated chloride channel family protein
MINPVNARMTANPFWVWVMLLAGTAWGQTLQESPVPILRVPVTVTNSNDRFVGGLKKEDFHIYQDDQEQQISTFSTEPSTLAVGILLDASGSMNNSKLSLAREWISQFLKSASPEDEFFLISFKDHPELIDGFTNSTSDILAGLATVSAGQRTAMFDAISLGLEKMRDAQHDHKALLVITDGGDNRSQHSEKEVLTEIRKSGVEIYSILMSDPYARTPEEREAPALLDNLCEQTGGQLFTIENPNASDIGERISVELHDQYFLGYTPLDLRHDGKWHKLKVKVTQPAGKHLLKVHARAGYYAPLQ